MLRLIKTLSLISMALYLVACATPPNQEYDPNASFSLGIPRFTPQDIDKSVQKWLTSMISSEPIASRTDRPVVLFGIPQNRSSEHVDMQEFQAAFEIAGTKSNKIRFSSVAQLGDQIVQQMKLQHSDLVNPDTAIKFGKMKGWRYSLYVELYSPTEPMTEGRKTFHFYRAVLKLINNETGELEWSDQQKFLRDETRATFGR